MTGVLARPTPLAGSLRFVRYAFMPNRLRFCGGDENRTLFEYGTERVVDGGLDPLLRRFTGALPYLQLIARANAIADPFDDRVVEAYWLGNELLAGVEVRQLHDALAERFGNQLRGRTRDWVLGKAPAGARPHHNFHVFDIHSRVGQLENTLETMDQCRVSWGRVVKVDGPELAVERQRLVLVDGKLALGPPAPARVVRQIEGRGFADAAVAGDWVSLHWDWVCEVLTPRQRANLARFTDDHIRIANQTL
ncbi:MAG: hypothetical protein AVDCRST_MAG73-1765 [uncultured Thermomicrobiales bacterium]|uniref:Uncharacterized protein n=1 Tax=uncultured Thermomicrobiales bacterium TaxID=1645740 RepID=A0A6J4U599_9BACT|nr:MAG: hypothetical protein AVDCRST_MAG73-1765 [uncultured Thermomicrobiales bacterium]